MGLRCCRFRRCRRLSWKQTALLCCAALLIAFHGLQFWRYLMNRKASAIVLGEPQTRPVTHEPSTEKHIAEQESLNRGTRTTQKPQRITTPAVAIPAATQKHSPDGLLDSVYISVKTGSVNHQSRLPVLLETWFNDAPKQTYFVTDSDDEDLQKQTGDHLIVSECGFTHSRDSLCCKAEQEFESFYINKQGKRYRPPTLHLRLRDQLFPRWFCHVDDDNYVNVPELINLLEKYNSSADYYLGKSSLARTIEISWTGKNFPEDAVQKPFWFATGGAGYCVSRALADKMEPHVRKGKFRELCRIVRLPDDVTLGFLSECMLMTTLTQLTVLHSHLEMQGRVPKSEVKSQVTYSYGTLGRWNSLIPIDGPFSKEDDPTRFKSFYCLMHPKVTWCPSNSA
eukprot:m.120075 g.120075  ORF g.120075 m.120075 type:complete len:396 (+) comp37721_c0_seq17:10-1197(+)